MMESRIIERANHLKTQVSRTALKFAPDHARRDRSRGSSRAAQCCRNSHQPRAAPALAQGWTDSAAATGRPWQGAWQPKLLPDQCRRAGEGGDRAFKQAAGFQVGRLEALAAGL